MFHEVDIRQVIFVALPATMLFGSICSALLAQSKGRDATYWMLWSFLFPPTVLLLLLFVGRSHRKKPRRRSKDEENDGMGSFPLP
jgi:uncharacterized membrane protein YfcA